MTAKRKLYPLVIIAILVVASAPFVWNLYWRVPGQLDFQLHHSTYDQMVRDTKKLPPPPLEKTGYFVNGSIKVYYARKLPNIYSITLITADWGHVGMAGYLYCDRVPTPTTGDPYSNVDAPGDLWMLEKQVAPHWWIISNHLQ